MQTSKMARPTAEFTPTLWGYHFLSFASAPFLHNGEVEAHQHLQYLKDQVRRQLKSGAKEPSEKLNLIDIIQRLGVSYHFESEIEDLIQRLNKNPPSWDGEDIDAHLYSIALWFRLLRQQGFHVSCDIFNKFKNDKGDFKMTLIDDVEGMLALYEAAHLGIHEEEILDQALEFTISRLKKLDGMKPYLQEKVVHALYCPIRKGVPRVETRYYISMYSRDDSRNDLLLEFAMLDFNLLQHYHQKELSHLTEWWKKLDFVRKVPYVRDRIVEGYFWPLGAYIEEQYSKGRIIVSKLINVLSAVDDTYDAYATFDELKIFTEAIRRWDINLINSLPECMKVVFESLIELFNEMESLTKENGVSCFVQYVKRAVQDLAEAYLVEAEWRDKGYIPTYEEYMTNALITSCYPVLETASFLGLGKMATKEVFDWISNDPKIVRASSVICRLTDDLASHKFERNREHVASAVECCMKQYGVSEEEAYKKLLKDLENAWKDINEECMKPQVVPRVVLELVLNFSRIIELMYGHFEDRYTNGELVKDHVAALLVNPVVIEQNK